MDVARKGERRRQEKQSDEADVKQELRPVVHCHQRAWTTTMHGDGGITPCALTNPSSCRSRREHLNGIVRINLHLRVLLGSHLADEYVVIASFHGIMFNESLVPEKQPLTIGEVLAHSHVGLACQCRREVHHAVLQGIETHQRIEQCVPALITAVANDHLGVTVVVVDHATQPLVAGGTAVCIGEYQKIVCGRLDAHRERELLTVEEVEVLPQLHRLDAWLATLQVLEELLGLIVAAVVHHHYLKLWIVLAEQDRDELGEMLIGIAGADHHGDWL